MIQLKHLSCVENGNHDHCLSQMCMNCGERFPCAERRAEDAEAAIQRVRDACENDSGFLNHLSGDSGRSLTVAQVLAALDGAE